MSEEENKDVKVSNLMHIKTLEIIPNPQNPRLLFDEKPLKELEKSIREVSILNPLLVYQRKKDKKIIILDGERRWICAKKIGLSTVPANVIEEPTPLENIIRMFNIHKIREDWDLMPTALKLEVIIKETGRSSDSGLSQLTNLPVSTVGRCKILLSFPKKYQELMLKKDPKDRIKTDFFIELSQVLSLMEKNLDNVKDKFSRNDITDIFLKKYLLKKFTNVVHFRKIADMIREVKKGGISKSDVEKKIITFLSTDNLSFGDMVNIGEEISKKNTLKKNSDKLFRNLEKVDIASIKNDSKLIQSLTKLKDIIDKKISEIKRFEGI